MVFYLDCNMISNTSLDLSGTHHPTLHSTMWLFNLDMVSKLPTYTIWFQEKNSYFTQPFFSLYSLFSTNLSGFSFDFWRKALETEKTFIKISKPIYPNPENTFIHWKKILKVPLWNKLFYISKFMWELKLSPLSIKTILTVLVLAKRE